MHVMRVFEITKEYAPAFSDFVPQYITEQIGKPGFHTLGEVSAIEDKHYGSGFLQFYDGRVKKSHRAKLTYIFVPEEERGEANAWSLMKEMERILKVLEINNIGLDLRGDQIDALKGYLSGMGFSEDKKRTKLMAAPIDMLCSEKLLKLPDRDCVHFLADVPKSESIRVLNGFGEKALMVQGIEPDLNSDSYIKNLSAV